MEYPFFSIIVVSYNAKNCILKTINSVLKQSFDNYEIVIKDAVSTDGTLDDLPADKRIRMYSEKDNGIYDGMNEAISYSRGRYLFFLNCGDFFADKDVLKNIYEFSKSSENENVIYGDYTRNQVLFKQPTNLTKWYLFRTPLCHQSMFFTRSLFDQYGLYDLSYKICADYDFTLKTFTQWVEYKYCPIVVCDYMGEGISESKKGAVLKKEEYKRIKKKYFTKGEKFRFSLKLFFSFRCLRKMMISDKAPKWIRKLYRKMVNKING